MAIEKRKDEDDAKPLVGALIRARRRRLQLTLQELADRASVSVGYLSQVERDLATPSLATLAQIARALDVGIDYFIATPSAADALTRQGRRPQFSVAGSSIVYERVGADFPGNQLSSFILTVPPGYRSEVVAHEGEEIIFMLEGSITQRLDEETMVIGPGDSLHFRGNRPHAWSNDTGQPARMLWTGTLALFRSRDTSPALGTAPEAIQHPTPSGAGAGREDLGPSPIPPIKISKGKPS